MADQELKAMLLKILDRLDKIELLLNSNEEYLVINPDKDSKYSVISQAISYSNSNESDDDIIPEEESYESDNEAEPINQQMRKLYLLTPDQVKHAQQ